MSPGRSSGRWSRVALRGDLDPTTGLDSADAPLRMLCEAALVVLFSWTLAYHLIAPLRLAAHWIWLPFLLLLATVGGASFRYWRRDLRGGRGDLRFLSGALLLRSLPGDHDGRRALRKAQAARVRPRDPYVRVAYVS